MKKTYSRESPAKFEIFLLSFRFYACTHGQTWLRPITPVISGVHSYAIAWASKRDDGSPYAIVTKLHDLGLTHQNGYKVIVSKNDFAGIWENCTPKIWLINLFDISMQDLFDENHKLEHAQSNSNFSVRVNPSGQYCVIACHFDAILIITWFHFTGAVFFKFIPINDDELALS